MVYEFVDEQGKPAVAEFDVGCAPKIGESALIDGRLLTRVCSIPREVRVQDVAHEAVGMRSLRHGVDPDVPRYSPEGVPGLVGGFPYFANRREIENYKAKKNEKLPEGRKLLHNA